MNSLLRKYHVLLALLFVIGMPHLGFASKNFSGCDIAQELVDGERNYVSLARQLSLDSSIPFELEMAVRIASEFVTIPSYVTSEILVKPEIENLVGFGIKSFEDSVKLLGNARGTPVYKMFADNPETGFLNHPAYAYLVSLGKGNLVIGDSHDVAFHLPSLLDVRNRNNLRRRSEVVLRLYSKLGQLAIQRGLEITFLPRYRQQGFDMHIEPYDREFNDLYSDINSVVDTVRFLSWEVLPSIRTDQSGSHSLKLWGGLGHNFALALEVQVGEKVERLPKYRVSFAISDIVLLKPRFHFFESSSLWDQFEAGNPDVTKSLAVASQELGFKTSEDIEKLVKMLTSELRESIDPFIDNVSDPLARQLLVVSHLGNVIGKNKVLRPFFEYEARQNMAKVSIDVVEEFADFVDKKIEAMLAPTAVK